MRGILQPGFRRSGSTLFLCAFAVAMATVSCSSLPTQTAEPEQVTIRQQAKEYSRLGDESLRNRDYAKAEENYRLSVEANASVDSLDGMSQAYNSLGNLMLGLGRYDDATDAFMNAEKQAKLAGDNGLVALALSNRAKIFLAQAKPANALELIDQSLALLGDRKDASTAVILHNRGVALKDLGKLDDAKTALKQSLAINESLKTLRERAANHYVLAAIASKEANTDDAVAELNMALDLDKKAENSQGIAADLYALATIFSRKTEKADLESAWAYAVRSFRVNLAASDASAVEKSLNQLVSLAATLNYSEEGATYKALLDKLLANKRKAADASAESQRNTK